MDTQLSQPLNPPLRQGAKASKRLSPKLVSLLQVAPMALVFFALVIVPLGIIFVVSFLDYGFAQVYPEIYLGSYADIFTSRLTIDLYLTSFKFVAIVWVVTLILGFWIAYYLVFHVRSPMLRAILFAACAIPFWTSSAIRLVSWVPLLGREGLINRALLGTGIVDQPVTWLLYSEFSVVIVYIHMLTLAMLGPIANSMAKVPRPVIQAAQDQGASEWQIVREIIIPLCKPGIVIGTIFVITAVMGDGFIVKQMSGSQVNTPVNAITAELNAFQYPPAAAKSVVMLAVVLFFVSSLLRFVDIRRELRK